MIPIKLWLHIILSTLIRVSDTDYQNRIWVKNLDEKTFDSYIETMCNLFDEGAVRIFIKEHSTEAGFSKEQTIQLEKVIDALDLYDGTKLTHEQLLKDPEWIKITDMAKEAIKILPKDTWDENKE